MQTSFVADSRHCYIGNVNRLDLNSTPLDWYGFVTVTQFKILLLFDSRKIVA
jgi:hypothetical protein